MATQIVRDTYGVITTGKFCQFGVRKKTNTGGSDEIPSNEMYFTTTEGAVEYVGTQGDQILLSDGTIIDVTITDEVVAFNAPEGKHKVKLIESVDRYNYVSVGGEALVELHNFPTLSSVNAFNTFTSNATPNLVKVPTVLPSNITSLDWMFYGVYNFNQDISMWDTSNVTDMNCMFYDATSFNQDLSGWCVSNITSKPYEFDLGATSWSLPRPVWGTCPVKPEDGETPSNEIHFTTTTGTIDYVGTQGDQILLSDGTIVDVTSTDRTFTYAAPSGKHKVKLVESIDRSDYVSVGGGALVELHNFPELSTVTKFNFATHDWNDTPNLTKVPEFLPSNITDIAYLFAYAENFNQDISMWDVSNVKIFDYAFSNATSFNQPIGNWNTSSAASMNGMFYKTIAFDQPLNNWNVSNVIGMDGMFYDASVFNQDISMWDVSNVTDMTNMFMNTNAFNQDISGWDVAKVTSMGGMFRYATAFDQPIGNWDTSNVTSTGGMFNGATSFNQDVSGWNVSNVTSMNSMFSEARLFNQDISNWNVSNVIGMAGMFSEASSFNQDISRWDVSNVTTMSFMFMNTVAFNQPLGDWDTSNVFDMVHMFENAISFNQDLSQWCVGLIGSEPNNFAANATNWSLPRPVWGTCPA